MMFDDNAAESVLSMGNGPRAQFVVVWACLWVRMHPGFCIEPWWLCLLSGITTYSLTFVMPILLCFGYTYTFSCHHIISHRFIPTFRFWVLTFKLTVLLCNMLNTDKRLQEMKDPCCRETWWVVLGLVSWRTVCIPGVFIWTTGR